MQTGLTPVTREHIWNEALGLMIKFSPTLRMLRAGSADTWRAKFLCPMVCIMPSMLPVIEGRTVFSFMGSSQLSEAATVPGSKVWEEKVRFRTKQVHPMQKQVCCLRSPSISTKWIQLAERTTYFLPIFISLSLSLSLSLYVWWYIYRERTNQKTLLTCVRGEANVEGRRLAKVLTS